MCAHTFQLQLGPSSWPQSKVGVCSRCALVWLLGHELIGYLIRRINPQIWLEISIGVLGYMLGWWVWRLSWRLIQIGAPKNSNPTVCQHLILTTCQQSLLAFSLWWRAENKYHQWSDRSGGSTSDSIASINKIISHTHIFSYQRERIYHRRLFSENLYLPWPVWDKPRLAVKAV